MNELKFPLDFTKCPICGSERRVAETILNQEKEANRIGQNVRAAVSIVKSVIADPRIMGFKAPVIMSFLDVCADCGTVYCIHAELGTAVTGAPQKGFIPPRQGFSPS